jgi:hypothetical protein
MRTKILVTAAALAASLATSMADNVYSLNVVGYVNQVYPAGFSMVATPLKTANNTVGEVLANAPAGTRVYKFAGGAYEVANTFDPEEGGWGNPAQTLPPGQGYFVKSPSQWTNTFVGEVVTASTNSLGHGFNMVGSVWPAAGNIDSALQLVPTSGDRIYSFNNGVGYNVANTYDPEEGGWGTPPNLNVAQGVFYKNAAASNIWVQSFTIAP